MRLSRASRATLAAIISRGSTGASSSSAARAPEPGRRGSGLGVGLGFRFSGGVSPTTRPEARLSAPTPRLDAFFHTRRGSVSPCLSFPRPSPTFHPALRSMRKPTLVGSTRGAEVDEDASPPRAARGIAPALQPRDPSLGAPEPTRGTASPPRDDPDAPGVGSDGLMTPPDAQRVVPTPREEDAVLSSGILVHPAPPAARAPRARGLRDTSRDPSAFYVRLQRGFGF